MISSDPRYQEFLAEIRQDSDESQRRWDSYFLSIADVVKNKSKDPSTKVGAVLVDPHNSIFSTGFNGFPIGVYEGDPTRWERPIKYEYVCHAERNAIALAARKGSATNGSTLYLVGLPPCTECTKMIIQSGIVRVVCGSKPIPESWKKDLEFSKNLLKEAGIQYDERTQA